LLKYASTRAEFDAILKGVPRQVGPDYEWIGGTQTAFNLRILDVVEDFEDIQELFC
jgi:hypothetical protein